MRKRRAAVMSLLGLLLIVAAGTSDSSAADGDAAAAAAAPGLYSFDASTGLLKQLIASEHEREDLTWSPDGAWIASEDTDDFLIDVIPPVGGTPRDVVSIEWSRTGSNAAYATRGGLFVGPSDWSKRTQVTRARGSDAIDWAPAGDRFVFGGGRASSCCWRSLRLARSSGAGARTLWTPPSDGPSASWIDTAAWSPSGNEIAVEATINNAVASRKGGEFLYLVNPGRRGAKKVPASSAIDLRGWSADGKWLLFGSDALFRVKPTGGRGQRLCPTPCADEELSPDMGRVAFVTGNEDSGPSTLWVSNIDGSAKRRIADSPGPMWVDWSGDGRKLGVAFIDPDTEHASVGVADLATGQVQHLTDGSHADFVFGGLSYDGSYVSFARVDQRETPELWVVGTNGGEAMKVMSLAFDPDLGPCPEAAWSPTAPTLAITNAACEPS
jgi:Tol biopolymer transport system component